MEYTYKYPRPAVTADCVVMTKETVPQVLLIERGADPYKGCWAFPGGFMNMDETTEQCAIRELEEETGMKVSELHQIGAYSKVDRDPRGRTITVAYLAIIDTPVVVTGQDDAAKAEWWSLSKVISVTYCSWLICFFCIIRIVCRVSFIPVKACLRIHSMEPLSSTIIKL